MEVNANQDDPSYPLTPAERLRFAGVLTAIMTVAVVAACSSCGGPDYAAHLPTTSGPPVAKLEVVNEEGGGSCTAWKVASDMIVTAGHCCSDDAQFILSGPHARPGTMATVLIDDDKHDVCVMRASMLGDAIPLALHDPVVGAPVWTAGYPLGTFLISTGIWSGRDSDGDGIASTAVGGGASGSPVMDADGRAVGVLRARYPRMGDSLTIIAPIEWVRVAVAQARRLPY